jgi:hypothetical protein
MRGLSLNPKYPAILLNLPCELLQSGSVLFEMRPIQSTLLVKKSIEADAERNHAKG